MIDGIDKINIWNIESFQQELDEVQDDWKSFGRKYAQLSDFIHSYSELPICKCVILATAQWNV